jgi:hypothetical protein
VTRLEIAARVRAIAAVHADDSKAAHQIEDCLFVDILRAIARGECDDPQACAALALASRVYDFPRVCA